MLGPYGKWAKKLVEPAGGRKDEFPWSFLNPRWSDVEEWKKTAGAEVLKLISPPGAGSGTASSGKISPTAPPEVRVRNSYTFDGIDIEELVWQLPYGPPAEAVFLKPAGETKKLPGILALHDHGGMKYFGKRKIIRTAEHPHPAVLSHQLEYYGGAAWANELAGRGYGVLVHDVFPFESRKINASSLPAHVVTRMMSPPLSVRELTPDDVSSDPADAEVTYEYDVPRAEHEEDIKLYDSFAARHEDIVAKALFSAGLTWPGVTLFEDRAALNYLASREDIDNDRIGCCGLSGGGLRTNYLAGLDKRIRCSVTAGFMTTWSDLLFQKCFTHTWMIYIPLLPKLMDFPDILGLHAPLPALVFATTADPLFTFGEVERAGRKLKKIYGKAGAQKSFKLSIHDGPHKFDLPMQEEAFVWFDKWLKKREE